MKEPINLIPSISYYDFFPDDDILQVVDLIKDIPSKSILIIIAHFMAKIHLNENNQEMQIKIFNQMINQQNDSIKNYLKCRLNIFINNNNIRFNFINNISCLYFYQILFENYNDLESRDLNAEEELKLLKAYLIVSHNWLSKEVEYSESVLKNKDDPISFILPIQIIYDEFQKYKDTNIQLIKSISFFNFCENSKDLSPILEEFLSKYNLTKWEEYLEKTINFYFRSITTKKASQLIIPTEENIARDYWNTFCLDVGNYKQKPDFLNLREYPVVKIDATHYLFYNLNFVIDKLFQNLQFVFSKIAIDKHYAKNMPDFKSKYYSEKFTENYLFYNVLEYCHSNQKTFVKYNGEQLNEHLGYRGPDYYIRNKNQIILIEFKDILMSTKHKTSYNFDTIYDEIKNKLVQNLQGKAKGVGQLSNFINKFPVNGFEFDKFDSDEIIIYPLLIVTDSAFCNFGINYLLNNEFVNLITPNKQILIKKLALMNLDIILLNQDLFQVKKINLFETLSEYDENLKQNNSDYLYTNFGMFLINYINSKENSHSIPKVLKEFYKKISENDQ